MLWAVINAQTSQNLRTSSGPELVGPAPRFPETDFHSLGVTLMVDDDGWCILEQNCFTSVMENKK